MIPMVALLDSVFALLAYVVYKVAPSKLTRRLCGALAVYCTLEMFFHAPAEALAARVMSRLWGTQ